MSRRARVNFVVVGAALCAAGAFAQNPGQVIRMGAEDQESFAEIIVEPEKSTSESTAGDWRAPRPERGEIELTFGEKVEPEREKRLREQVLERFAWAKAQLSSVDTSPVSSINQRAGVHAVVTPPEVCAPIRGALALAEKTDGAFDPTLQTDPEKCAKTGFRKVDVRNTPFAVSDPPCTLRYQEAGMRLDLDLFAQAWALDQAAALLRREGIERFRLVAGDLGIHSGQPLMWDVPVPQPEGKPAKLMAVTDRAFAVTSHRDGQLVDPRTCRQIPENRSALALASSAVDALGFSRAAVTLTPSAALKWLEVQRASGVLLIDDELVFTADLEPIFRPPPPPDAGFRFP